MGTISPLNFRLRQTKLSADACSQSICRKGLKEIAVPRGTKHGCSFTYEGLGLPEGVDSEQGDLEVTFLIDKPTFGDKLARFRRGIGL